MSVRYQCGANSQLRSFGTHHITLWEILRQTPPKWLMEWYRRGHGAFNLELQTFKWMSRMIRLGMRDRSWLTLWESNMQRIKEQDTIMTKEGTNADHERLQPPQSGKDTATYTGRSRHASCVTWKPNGGNAIPTTPPGIPTIKDKLQWSQEGWWEHVWIVQLQSLYFQFPSPRSSLLG